MAASSISILVPIAYIALVIGTFLLFGHVYRKRTAARIAQQDPWFPSHPDRDTYISLLQLSPPPSDVLLKAALLRRAVTDVRRILAFREDKTALQALLQKGSIGDDLWNAFLAAEKELEAEIIEVVAEANTFHEGWGQFIFQSASEMVNNMKHRDLFFSIPKLKAETEAKYGSKKPKFPVKTITSQLAVPSPQVSAPASPKAKKLASPSLTSSGSASSMTKSASNGSSSANGDMISTASSPSTPSNGLPKAGGKKNRKRK